MVPKTQSKVFSEVLKGATKPMCMIFGEKLYSVQVGRFYLMFELNLGIPGFQDKIWEFLYFLQCCELP